MSKFVFIVPPFWGHINPTLAVGAELLAEKHEVAWLGHESVLAGKLPPGGALLPLELDIDQYQYDTLVEKANSIRGLMSLKFLYDDILVPLAKATYEKVKERVEQYNPDTSPIKASVEKITVNSSESFSFLSQFIPYSFCRLTMVFSSHSVTFSNPSIGSIIAAEVVQKVTYLICFCSATI